MQTKLYEEYLSEIDPKQFLSLALKARAFIAKTLIPRRNALIAQMKIGTLTTDVKNELRAKVIQHDKVIKHIFDAIKGKDVGFLGKFA